MKIKFVKITCLILLSAIFSVNKAYAQETVNNPYEGITNNCSEEECEELVQMIYWEAARCGCSLEVLEATAQTAFNRMLSPDPYFPDTLGDVIRQKGQFVTVKYFYTEPIPEGVRETISDAISEVVNGVMVLPNTNYVYFATAKQSVAKNHIWIGARWANGAPYKGLGMYYGESK